MEIKYLREVLVPNKSTTNSDIYFYLFKIVHEFIFNNKNNKYALVSYLPFPILFQIETDYFLSEKAYKIFKITKDGISRRYDEVREYNHVQYLTEEEVMPLVLL